MNIENSSSLVAFKNKRRGVTAGDIFSLMIFICLILLLLSTTLDAWKEMHIDLTTTKSHEGEVTERKTSVAYGKWNTKNIAFNLTLKGLRHPFRFFNNTNNFSALLAEVNSGDIIKVYYSNYGYHLYQIEKNGKILFDKEIYESKQVPKFVMGLIFLLISTWALIFMIKRIRRKFNTIITAEEPRKRSTKKVSTPRVRTKLSDTERYRSEHGY